MMFCRVADWSPEEEQKSGAHTLLLLLTRVAEPAEMVWRSEGQEKDVKEKSTGGANCNLNHHSAAVSTVLTGGVCASTATLPAFIA